MVSVTGLCLSGQFRYETVAGRCVERVALLCRLARALGRAGAGRPYAQYKHSYNNRSHNQNPWREDKNAVKASCNTSIHIVVAKYSNVDAALGCNVL